MNAITTISLREGECRDGDKVVFVHAQCFVTHAPGRADDHPIVEHNTRLGGRSEISGGRSFADVHAKAPIRKLIEEQRLLWLMGVEELRAEKDSGMLRFLNNSQWAEFMINHAGKYVAARFGPDNLQDVLYFYATNGSLGS